VNQVWYAAADDTARIEATERSKYEETVSHAIADIRSGILEKIVCSRVKIVDRGKERLYEVFSALRQTYPGAFTFMYHVPSKGTWCGATPEILLSQDDNVTQTMALAGTLPYTGQALSDSPWTPKEVHEQDVIQHYVEEALDELELTYTKQGPVTVRAGAMVHLQSIYKIDAGDHALDLIEKLHPGPAICGRPKLAAWSWISEHEAHDREHYCGYIGPWGILDQKAIFINLRSMRIYKDRYALFLGGGITEDSQVHAEWDETELKARTMLSVINQTDHD